MEFHGSKIIHRYQLLISANYTNTTNSMLSLRSFDRNSKEIVFSAAKSFSDFSSEYTNRSTDTTFAKVIVYRIV